MNDTPLTDALIRKVYEDCEHYVHVLYVHGCTLEQELAEANHKAQLRGQKMEIMRDYLMACPGYDQHGSGWAWFASLNPSSENWFDEDGVPK